MDKGFKVKRNTSKIYRKNRSKTHSPFAIGGAVLLVVVLFVIGWFVYPPVYDMLTGKTELPRSSEKQAKSSSQNSTAAVNPPEKKPEEKPKEQPQVKPKPEAVGELRAVYAPPALLQNQAELENLLQKASAAGYNALLFDAKDDTGRVLYRSQNETAKKSEAIAQPGLNLTELTKTLAKYDMQPVARLHAFKDHMASAKNGELAVKYSAQKTLWLDDYPNRGGKTWLNPYSTAAQDYIIALARECAQAGAKTVLLDSVRFPNAAGIEMATYGDTAGKTKEQALTAFVARAQAELEKEKATLLVYSPVSAAMELGGTEYLGKPTAYQGALAVNAMPAVWGEGNKEAALQNPVQKPYDTVLTTLRVVQTKTKARLVPFVQAYTDDTVPQAANKPYTAEDVTAQLDALGELKIGSYIVYSPKGEYMF